MVKDKSIYLALMGIESWQLRPRKEKELLSAICKALNVGVRSMPVTTYSVEKMLLSPQLKREFWKACLLDKNRSL